MRSDPRKRTATLLQLLSSQKPSVSRNAKGGSMTLRIDPEFEALIPPLAGDELTRLAKSLEAEGMRDPILVWREPGAPKKQPPTIVDGHNRYKIAHDLGISYTTCKLHLKDRAAVKAWILANQIARRNLSQDQITLLFVSRGAEPPNRPLARQVQDAQLVAQHPDFCARVLRGDPGWSLRTAANALRPRTPRTPRPATAASEKPDRSGGSGNAPAPVVAVSGGVAASHDATDVAAARLRLEASRAAADVKALQRKLVEAEKAAEFYTSIGAAKPIVVAASRPKSGKRQGVVHTCASDWHVGEVVSAEETHGRNTYDLATARARAARFWDNVLWLRRDITRHVESPDHVLSLNGDMISGSIHAELAETNECSLVDQVGEAIAMLEPGIRALAADVPGRLVIPCIHGNHGRWTEKSHVKTGWATSLESMLYRHLRDRCRDLGNVEWIIPKAESVSHEVLGFRVRYQHGTHIRSQGGIGGILVPLTRWAIRQNTADLYVFGHFHQACTFGRVIVNGSLIGESAYSTEMGFEYRPPEQTNWVVDAQHGLRRFDPVSVT